MQLLSVFYKTLKISVNLTDYEKIVNFAIDRILPVPATTWDKEEKVFFVPFLFVDILLLIK